MSTSSFPLADCFRAADSLLLIDSIHAPCPFLLLELIQQSLKQQHIFLFTTSPVLYLNCLKKRTAPLNNFTPIQLPVLTQATTTTTTTTTTIPLTLHQSITLHLRQHNHHPNHPPLVIIDDINALIWAGNQPAEQLITQFKLILPAELNINFKLILVFHDDLLKSNQRDRHILNHLITDMDIIVRTRSLGTPAQGELIIQRGPACLHHLHLPITLSMHQTTHFKINDHTVTFHPKGLDRGFI